MRLIAYISFYLFFVVSLSHFSGCSGGTISPDKLCNYANLICQNVQAICGWNHSKELTTGEKQQLENYLKSVVDSLSHYEAKFSE